MRGAIASEHALASSVGAAILERGGNAVDAAIGTAVAVGTLNPYHSCIGGGGFAIVRTEQGVESVDFRVTAPVAATSEFYLSANTDHGGAAVGVPGEVAGFKALHEKHGKLPWSELFTESIALAESAPMGNDLYDYLSLQCSSPPKVDGWLAADPEFVKTFTSNGEIIPKGGQWRRGEYANTLRAIAADPSCFYSGEIADAIVKSVVDSGGLMTVQDLKSYKPIWRTPLSVSFGNETVYAPPAPASGAILLSALATLHAAEHRDRVHATIEALRYAYGQRTLLGDPAYVGNLDALQTEMIATAATRTIKENTLPVESYLPESTVATTDSGTSHITAADENGVVCSITTTIGQLFAARIMVPGTGIMLNDSMDDFSVAGKSNHFGYAPSPVNYVAGGKRPLSSQCPYIVMRGGKPILAGGSAGGATIISANMQVISNLLSGMTAEQALAAPRLHDMVLPNKTQLERGTNRGGEVVGWSEEQATDIAARGHVVEWIDKSMSTPTCIRILPEGWDAAGDPRKYDAAGAGIVVG